MQLSARMLTDVATVNQFRYANAIEFVEGDGPTLYFQLIDTTLDRATDGYVPGGRRYMPAAGATLVVTVDTLSDASKVTRTASQPFAGDPSIWSIQLMSTDPVRGTASLRFVLTESAKITRGSAINALSISPQNANS